MVVIQDAHGSLPSLNDLPLEERYARLDSLMRYAAGRADNFKLLLNEYRDEDGELIPPKAIHHHVEQREALCARLDSAEWKNRKLGEELTEVYKQRDLLEAAKTELYLQLENSLADSSEPEPTLMASTLEENLKEAERKIETMALDLKKESEVRSCAEIDRDQLQSRLEKIQADLDAVSEARAESELQRNELAETIEDLEGDLAAGTQRITTLSNEISGLKEELEASKRVEDEVVSLANELNDLKSLQEESRFEKESLINQLTEIRAEANELRHQISALSTANVLYSAQPMVNTTPVEEDIEQRVPASQADTAVIEVAATPMPPRDDPETTESLEESASAGGDSIMDSYLRFLKSK
jgi:DNA repair exonuclease SbcCD ATPase subunit